MKVEKETIFEEVNEIRPIFKWGWTISISECSVIVTSFGDITVDLAVKSAVGDRLVIFALLLQQQKPIVGRLKGKHRLCIALPTGVGFQQDFNEIREAPLVGLVMNSLLTLAYATILAWFGGGVD
uniref:Uncharacterized protein n=1 Tax=Oryza rufipogon TaxID=4529 RepID=A0A0E0QBL2_ORYRU